MLAVLALMKQADREIAMKEGLVQAVKQQASDTQAANPVAESDSSPPNRVASLLRDFQSTSVLEQSPGSRSGSPLSLPQLSGGGSPQHDNSGSVRERFLQLKAELEDEEAGCPLLQFCRAHRESPELQEEWQSGKPLTELPERPLAKAEPRVAPKGERVPSSMRRGSPQSQRASPQPPGLTQRGSLHSSAQRDRANAQAPNATRRAQVQASHATAEGNGGIGKRNDSGAVSERAESSSVSGRNESGTSGRNSHTTASGKTEGAVSKRDYNNAVSNLSKSKSDSSAAPKWQGRRLSTAISAPTQSSPKPSCGRRSQQGMMNADYGAFGATMGAGLKPHQTFDPSSTSPVQLSGQRSTRRSQRNHPSASSLFTETRRNLASPAASPSSRNRMAAIAGRLNK